MKDLSDKYLYVIGIMQNELETFIRETGTKSLIIKFDSINSAICAAIAQPVCHKTNTLLLGRSFKENDDIRKLGEFYTNDFKIIDLSEIENTLTILFDKGINIFENEPDNINMKHEHLLYLESSYLTYLSNYYSGLILGTLDYTNLLLGNYLPNIDLVDFNLLLYLWKSEVHDIARYYIQIYENNNENIFKNLNNLLDKNKYYCILEEEISYKDIDKIFINYSQDKDLEENVVIQQYLNSWVKRAYPLAIDRNLFSYKGDV